VFYYNLVITDSFRVFNFINYFIKLFIVVRCVFYKIIFIILTLSPFDRSFLLKAGFLYNEGIFTNISVVYFVCASAPFLTF